MLFPTKGVIKLIFKEVKVGEMIRNRKRECFLVVTKSTQGLFVINLMTEYTPPIVQIILPKDMDKWSRDIDIDDLAEWEKDLLEKKFSEMEE